MTSSRRRALAGLLGLLWLGILGAAAVRLWGRAVDDVFITYRYAQNLAAGQGFVFNPGERVFGVTEPAVGLLLACAARATGAAIPSLGTLYTALALAALALGFLAGGRRRQRTSEAALFGTLLLATPFLWSTQGAAAPAVLALLLLAGQVAASRPLLAGALCAFAVTFRPDALVGAAILGALLLFETRRMPWRFALTAFAGVALAALAAWLWFGAVIPQTLLAKQYHAARNPGSWIGFQSFWGFGLASLRAGPWGAIAMWAMPIGLAAAPFFLSSAKRAERVVVIDGLALLAIYPFLRVPFFWWYAIPPAVAGLWGLAQLAGWAVREAAARRSAARIPPAAAGAAAALVAAAWLGAFALYLHDARADWRTVVYMEAGRWLRDHAAPDADLAFHEVGMLAFSSQRKVEDLLGLVSPRSLPYAREGDVVGAFLAKPTAYFVAHPFADGGAMRAITSRDWFRDAYREVARFDHPELGGWIAIFARRAGAVLPLPQPPRPRRLLPAQPAS
jgi:hypothetical protein